MYKQKRNVFAGIIRWLSLAVFIASLGMLAVHLYTDYAENQAYTAMAEEFIETEEETIVIDEWATPDEQQASITYKKVNVTELHAQNREAVGWISIDGTPVNYAVMHAADNDKYLTRNANGAASATGAIFIDYSNKIDPLDANIVLYGHNMGTTKTTMFSTLVRYKQQSYYSTHPYVRFDTYLGTGIWKIFAAFQVNVYNTPFNYAQRYFLNANDFNTFVSTAKSISYFTADITPRFGDKIITLSTCDRSNYGADGRFIVMAVLVGGTLTDIR